MRASKFFACPVAKSAPSPPMTLLTFTPQRTTQLLALVPLCMLINDGNAGRMWHRTTVYILQMLASGGCVGLAAYVLYGEGARTHEPIKPAPGEPEEPAQSPWDRIKALANLFTKK
jgi:hypothetical protein